MARTLMQIFLALSLFGSINQAVANQAEENLDGWLRNELIPYLKSHFGRHPRLKGEPFQIRAMRDGRIVARMDGLTAYIRQRISDTLQAVPEANLIRPIPFKPWSSPRSLEELRCPSTDRVKVQLTIEVERRPASGKVKVSIQALDLLEQAWVRGFKKVWTGELTLTEQRRLARQQVDKGLIGSRELPFREGQPDLLAAHQAAEVGCMLRQGGRRNVKLFLSLPQGLESGYFRRAGELLAQYLSALREVQIVDKRDEAGALLTLQVHRIDEALYQVWTSLGSGEDSDFVEPSALAYVALPSKETQESAQKKQPTSSLISRFQLIVPTDQASCDASNPWEKGYVVLGQQSHLSSGGFLPFATGLPPPQRSICCIRRALHR